MNRSSLRRPQIVLLSVLATLLVAELGWRLYLGAFAPFEKRGKYMRMADMPVEALRFRPHHYLGYVLNEAYRPPGPNRHNALGFRGEETTLAKPEGVYRIACLGGSTTYTVEVEDYRLAYPAVMQETLRGIHGHTQVEVINAGVGGYGSWESMLNLQLRVLELDPDLVVVYHGTNDVQPRLVNPDTYTRDNAGYRKRWCTQSPWWDHSLFIRYLGVQWGFSPRNALAYLVKNPGVPDADHPEWLDQNSPRYFEDNLRNIYALCAYRGIPVLFTSWAHSPQLGDYASLPPFRKAFDETNEVSRRVAEETGSAYYDFAAQMPQQAEYWADGRHVNEAGSQLKGELFAAWIAREILSN